MCDKAVNICAFPFTSVSDQYITREMCDKVVSIEPFMLIYCPNK